MSTEPVPDDFLAAATRRIVAALDPAAVLVFGSRATGLCGPASDFDLAVLMARDLPGWETIRDLQLDLEEALAAEVDLVMLDTASPILAMQVLQNGRLLVCRDREALESFTVTMLTDYADLKIVRRPIERRLLESNRP